MANCTGAGDALPLPFGRGEGRGGLRNVRKFTPTPSVLLNRPEQFDTSSSTPAPTGPVRFSNAGKQRDTHPATSCDAASTLAAASFPNSSRRATSIHLRRRRLPVG